jgi:hypothetical protein
VTCRRQGEQSSQRLPRANFWEDRRTEVFDFNNDLDLRRALFVTAAVWSGNAADAKTMTQYGSHTRICAISGMEVSLVRTAAAD